MSENKDTREPGDGNSLDRTPRRHASETIKKNPLHILIYFVLGFSLVLVDQVTKYLAMVILKDGADIVLIPDVFELHYLENQSAAFGMDPVSLLQKAFSFSYFIEHPESLLACKMLFLVLLTVLVLVLLIYLFLRIPGGKHFLPLNLTIVFFIAGAIGNCIDRVARQYVIDFFYFKLIDFPVFNVADIYVTVSTAILILLAFFFYKETDYEEIFPSRKSACEANIMEESNSDE